MSANDMATLFTHIQSYQSFENVCFKQPIGSSLQTEMDFLIRQTILLKVSSYFFLIPSKLIYYKSKGPLYTIIDIN